MRTSLVIALFHFSAFCVSLITAVIRRNDESVPCCLESINYANLLSLRHVVTDYVTVEQPHAIIVRHTNSPLSTYDRHNFYNFRCNHCSHRWRNAVIVSLVRNCCHIHPLLSVWWPRSCKWVSLSKHYLKRSWRVPNKVDLLLQTVSHAIQ
jgi:hypothetical protein